jgi:hypothetical protein
MFSSSFIPLINRPTRVTSTTATLIDNIFTNRQDIGRCYNGIIPTDVTDHFSIFHIIYNDHVPHHVCTKTYKHIFNESTLKHFKSSIQSTDWHSVIQRNDTGEAYQTFYNKFTDIFRTTIPIKQVCNDSYKKQ